MIRWWRSRRRWPEPEPVAPLPPEPEPEPEPEPAPPTVKGNAATMLFHTPESPYYGRVRADVWFESEEAARAAGYGRWDER